MDRARLGDLVRRRRVQLGLSVNKAAHAARIARTTWIALEEAGERETASYIYGPVERALGWRPGSIEAVLAGGDPSLADDRPIGPPPRLAAAELALRRIEEVVDFKGLSNALKIDTIRGILVAYRRDVEQAEEDLADEEPPGHRAAG